MRDWHIYIRIFAVILCIIFLIWLLFVFTIVPCGTTSCNLNECVALDCYGYNCKAGSCNGDYCKAGDCYGENCQAGDCTGPYCQAGDCYGYGCQPGKCNDTICKSECPSQAKVCSDGQAKILMRPAYLFTQYTAPGTIVNMPFCDPNITDNDIKTRFSLQPVAKIYKNENCDLCGEKGCVHYVPTMDKVRQHWSWVRK